MKRKVLQATAFLSLICFLYGWHSTFKVAETFKHSFIFELFNGHAFFVTFFFILFVMSLFQKILLTYITLILGLIWPAIFSPFGMLKWAFHGVFSKFSGAYVNMWVVLSGIASWCFILILLLLIILILNLCWRKYHGRRLQ
jgi:hypothetical protein